MKIAVVHNLPAGGHKRALYNQVKILSKKHKIDLYTLSSTDDSFLPLKEFVNNHFIFPYSYPPHFPQSVISIYFYLPHAYQNMAEKINQGDYDVAFVAPCYLTQAPYILRYLKIPSLYFCPEPKREFYEKIPRISNRITYSLTYPFRLPLKNIDRTNTRWATRILTNSKYSKAKIDKIYEVSSFVNYLGVDTDVFYSSTPGESIRPPPGCLHRMVLSIGELSLHKGHDFIIRSLARIKRGLRPKLVIVGHGGVEKNYLQKLAGSLGVEMEVLEDIPDKKLVSLYNKAKVFLYAARNEPFGMVLLEASSCGLPIVAVEEGGVTEVITDKLIGDLVRRDEDRFAEIVKKYLVEEENFTKVKKRHELVKKKWSWERSVEELERHLREIAL